MIITNYKLNEKKIAYELMSDGYLIYLGGEKWIKQNNQYAKLYLPEGTFEENCLAHIAELCTVESVDSTEVLEPTKMEEIDKRITGLEAQNEEISSAIDTILMSLN